MSAILLMCGLHFHYLGTTGGEQVIVAELAERCEKLWKQEKVGDGAGKTPPGKLFRRRQLSPVGLADEDDPSGAQALRQQFDGSS
jgi:hypothetical protein